MVRSSMYRESTVEKNQQQPGPPQQKEMKAKKRRSKHAEKYRKELNYGGEVKKSKVRVDTEQSIAKTMKMFPTVEMYTDTKIKPHVVSDGTTMLTKFSK